MFWYIPARRSDWLSTGYSDAFTSKRPLRGFPGDSAVRNPPASAGATVQSMIWEGSTCHEAQHACAPTATEAARQSPGATALKAVRPSARARHPEKPQPREACTAREQSPLAATRESRHSTEDLAQPTVMKLLFKYFLKRSRCVPHGTKAEERR